MDTWVVASSTAEGIVLGWSGSVNQDDAVDTADAADVNGIVPDGSDGIIAPENDAIPLDSGPAAQKKKHPAEVELENSSDFGKLPSYQQQALRDYVYKEDPDEATAVERAKKVTSLSFTIADVNGTENKVGDFFIDKLKNEPDLLVDLEAFAQRSCFKNPVLKKAAVNGSLSDDGSVFTKSARQLMLLQIMAQLSRKVHQSNSDKIRTIFTNTITIINDGNSGLGLLYEVAPDADSDCRKKGLCERDSDKPICIYLNHTELKISESGIGDKTGTLRKLAHEINHACRARGVGDSSEEIMADEFYAYMTELLAAGESVTREQVDQTFGILRKKPYNLSPTIDSNVGKDFIAALRYKTDASSGREWELLQFPLPNATPNSGWNVENEFPA